MSTAHAGIIVLAAGASSRYGAPKLALPFGDTTLVRRAVLAAVDACRHVIVVTGAHADAVTASIAQLPVTISFNPDWQRGIGSSIAHGVARLRADHADAQAALIALADQYRVTAVHFMQLLQAHRAEHGSIAAAAYADTVGVPCVFPRDVFDELAALQGRAGARAILRRHAQRVRALPIAEAACDIDTPEDYAAALRQH